MISDDLHLYNAESTTTADIHVRPMMDGSGDYAIKLDDLIDPVRQ